MKERHQSETEEVFPELPNSWEERGIRKGIQLGLEQSKEKAKKEIAINLLKEGAPIEFIAKVTHLDKKAIEELKTNNKSTHIDNSVDTSASFIPSAL